MVFRTLTRDDIAGLHRLEAESYLPSLHESDEAFLRLIELFPAGALGCFDDPGTFYVDDVAVAERCRGRGVGPGVIPGQDPGKRPARSVRSAGIQGDNAVSRRQDGENYPLANRAGKSS